jgi:hypothetical protein
VVHHKLGCRGSSTGIGLQPELQPWEGAFRRGLIFREDFMNCQNLLDFSTQKVIIEIDSQ